MADNKNETIADIVAEMRGYAAGLPDAYHVTMSWHDFRVVLTRIEAAAKREREDAVGNAAAMSAALEIAHDYFDGGGTPATDAAVAVESALSIPPRNCDRFEKFDSVVEAFRNETGIRKHMELWLISDIRSFVEWLLTPAMEGENDGSK